MGRSLEWPKWYKRRGKRRLRKMLIRQKTLRRLMRKTLKQKKSHLKPRQNQKMKTNLSTKQHHGIWNLRSSSTLKKREKSSISI